jgi:hypothetical protein
MSLRSINQLTDAMDMPFCGGNGSRLQMVNDFSRYLIPETTVTVCLTFQVRATCLYNAHETERSGQLSCFVFGRSRAEISATVISIEGFHVFPQYLRANAGIVH